MNKNRVRMVKLKSEEEAVVTRDGIQVIFNNEGGISVFGSVSVSLHAPVNDASQLDTKPQLTTGPQIGDKMEDGTIFAGISPDTSKPMYACPTDAPFLMVWHNAIRYAENFKGYGKREGSFRLPTARELGVMFNNRAAIGGFNQTGRNPEGWYFSSTELNLTGSRYSDDYHIHIQGFSEGDPRYDLRYTTTSHMAKGYKYAVRLICD